VGALIVTALLSLSFTSTVFSKDQQSRDRLTAAADSATDATLETLARAAGSPGALGSDCNLRELVESQWGTATVNDAVTPLNGPELGEFTINGHNVGVQCFPRPTEGPPVAASTTGDQMWITGKNQIRSDACGTNPDNPAWTTPSTQCLDWASLLPSADVPAARSYTEDSAALVHAGAGPLKFVGKVHVAGGAVAVNNYKDPADGTFAGTNGIAVGGLYEQTYGGVGSGSAQCRRQTPVSPDNDSSKRAWIKTIRLLPDCGGSVPSSPELSRPVDESSLGAPVITAAQLNCSPGNTVNIPSGSYGPAAIEQLNNLTSGGCQNKVFLFKPGFYYFDAVTPTGVVGALRFNDPTSVFVFGEPEPDFVSSTASAASVADKFTNGQKVCKSGRLPGPTGVTYRGVAIQLSLGTSIRHRGGRLAICDVREQGSNVPATAIWQADSALNPVVVTPVGVSSSLPSYTPPGFGTSEFVVNALPGGGLATAKLQPSCGQSSAFGVQVWTCQSQVGSLAVPTNSWSTQFPAPGSGDDRLINDLRVEVSGTIPAGPKSCYESVNVFGFIGCFNNGSQLPRVDTSSAYAKVSVQLPPLPGGTLPLECVGTAKITGPATSATQPDNPVATPSPSAPSTYNVSASVQLLSGSPDVNCLGGITRLSDLSQASVKIDFVNLAPYCSDVFSSSLCYPPPDRTDLPLDPWELPSMTVTSVKVTAKDTLSIAPAAGQATKPFLFTVNPTSSNAAADLRIEGNVALPGAAVDIRWNGDAPAGTTLAGVPVERPLIYGSAVLGSLLSSSSVASGPRTPGVVCCTEGRASERNVDVLAWNNVKRVTAPNSRIEGQLGSRARFTFEDYQTSFVGNDEVQYARANRVRINRWELCSSRQSVELPGRKGDGSMTAGLLDAFDEQTELAKRLACLPP
jgi:hypothetical protein